MASPVGDTCAWRKKFVSYSFARRQHTERNCINGGDYCVTFALINLYSFVFITSAKADIM